jgi:hypothetical protein
MPLRVSGNPTNISKNGRSRTGTHLSTNIYLAVDDGSGPSIVGAVQTLQVNEKRTIKKIPEVGTDGIIDSAPSASAEISGSCTRVRFDGIRIAQAFRRGFIHVHAQRIPFDIQIYDIMEGDADSENVIITEIKNVWINSIGYTYHADNFIISEDMGWDAETIQSTRGNSNNVVNATSPYVINPFEREADMGKYRGALDAVGLLTAFDGAGGNNL